MPSKKRKHQHTAATSGEEMSHDEVWDDTALLDSWESAVEEYKYYHSLQARGENVEVVLDAAEAGDSIDIYGNGTTQNDQETFIEEGEHEEDGTNSPTRATPSIKRRSLNEFEESEDDNISTASFIIQETSLQHPYLRKSKDLVRQVFPDVFPSEPYNAASESAKQLSRSFVEKWKDVERLLRELPKDDAMKKHFVNRVMHAHSRADAELPAHTIAPESTETAFATPVDAMSRTPSQNDPGLKGLMMSWYWAGYYGGLYEGQRQVSGTAPQ